MASQKQCCILLLYIWLASCGILAHGVSNHRLLRVEPLTTVKLDIAPRPGSFFEKRHITRNPSHEPSAQSIEHDDILRLAVDVFNATYYLHLFPNLHLFHPDAVIYRGDGKEEKLDHEQFRIYRGQVVDPAWSEQRWLEDQAGVYRDDDVDGPETGVLGWARIVIRNDLKHDLSHPVFEGTYHVFGNTHHIKATSNYKLAKRSDDVDLTHGDHGVHMVVYRDSDMKHPLEHSGTSVADPQCGFDRLSHGSALVAPNNRPALRMDPLSAKEWGMLSSKQLLGTDKFMAAAPHLLKRGPPSGCPTSKKILYMGAAADCTYTKHYQSASNARMQILNDWNSASAVYERQFNIQLGLINITIMPEICPSSPSSAAAWNQDCSDAYSITNRLSDFSQWRASTPDDGAGLWHLMTSCATGVEVGIAWMKQVCNTGVTSQREATGVQYVSGTGLSSIIRDEWKVVAHEIGHGFGAIHDCTASTCPCNGPTCQCCPLSATQCDAGGTYIMNPSSNASASDFSPCSVTTVCNTFPTVGSCLQEPGSRTVKTLQMCGNGLKEDGEDCDTGGKDTACCDAKTCKFKPNAKCEDYNDMCCNNCQLRPANYACRPSTSVCDVAETCDGTSAACPADKFKDDGTSCGDGGLQCASGQCTSRDEQCKTRGSTMNITRACSAGISGCDLVCDAPGAMTCIMFNGRFRDGTPCGVGGSCNNGSCDMHNFGNNVKSWFENNKQIAIPVGIVIGLLLLLCISRCICMSRGGYRNLQAKNEYVVTAAPVYGVPPYPPQPYYGSPPGQMPPPSGWVDPAAYNGGPRSASPVPPPPSYTPTPDGHTRDVYEMTPVQHDSQWRPSSPSPQPSPSADVSGRVRRFQEGAV